MLPTVTLIFPPTSSPASFQTPPVVVSLDAVSFEVGSSQVPPVQLQ
jgi:hypothetical protein